MSLFDQISSPYGVGAAPYRYPVVTQPNDSVLAATSRGGIPLNVLQTNFGGNKDSRPGRSVLESLADCGEMGSGLSGVNETFNSDSNGGSGPGAGQANQTEAPSSGQMHTVATTFPVSAVTIPAAPQYQG